MSNIINFEEAKGKVFRHKRLFNFIVIPISETNGIVSCISGNNLEQDIPMDYFKRDWKIDLTINPTIFLEKLKLYPDKTSATVVYTEFFEPDDGTPQAYLHFDDFSAEELYRFPLWKISVCKKEERNKKINPFTMIMPLNISEIDIVEADIKIINDLRRDNEYIQFEDFKGFEFGLIKFLEKKYLRNI